MFFYLIILLKSYQNTPTKYIFDKYSGLFLLIMNSILILSMRPPLSRFFVDNSENIYWSEAVHFSLTFLTNKKWGFYTHCLSPSRLILPLPD